MPRIVPSLISIIKGSTDEKDDDEVTELGVEALTKEKEANVVTYELEEAENAVKLIRVFLKHVPEGFIPYIDQSVQIILPLIDFTMSQDLRKQASRCLPMLMRCLLA